MMRVLAICFLVGLALAFTFSLTGCGSESGGTEEVAATSFVQQSFDERCDFCHGPGRSQDLAVVHSIAESSPDVSIVAVREVNVAVGDDRLEVDFNIFDSDNPLIPIPFDPAVDDTSDPRHIRNIRFTVAKLVPGAGGASNWQSYINRSRAGPSGDVTQGTYERASEVDGVFTVLGDGMYRYRFSFNMNTVTDPVSGAAIAYEKALTHRIAMQVVDNVDNAFIDFESNALPIDESDPVFPPAVAVTRNIVVNASCHECHIRLGFHGGDRTNVNYCVTCHNQGSTDDESGNTVDFKIMIHKIHRGEDLPEVEAGGEYTVAGHDYSTVVFPQDIRNCTKCHRNASDSDNWKNLPNSANRPDACTTCHDDPMDPDYPLFPALTAQEVTDAHTIAEQVAAQTIQFNILDIGTAAGTAGALDLTIQFSITDPTNADMPYDITDTTTTDFTGLSFLVGWNTNDYNNTGSGSVPAQPPRVSVTDATDNGDGTYTVTASNIIPAGVTGSGIVALQGHPDRDLDGDGDVDDRVPATSVTEPFAITDDPDAQDRRVIVDAANCNQCHGLLSLHGGNRNNNTQVCIICHNPNATDIERRPLDAATTSPDGQAEEAIDLKYMIHSIHAGAAAEHGFRTNGIVIYGRSGTPNDFSHVRLPAEERNLMNCEGCHEEGTFEIPIKGGEDQEVAATTKKTGDNLADPDDDQKITPTAAVCSSCHDDIDPKTHMTENGGRFDFVPVVSVTEEGGGLDQLAFAPGPVSAQPPGHTSRTDCASCHGGR